ncbi:MAG: iron-sulfur cluster assembly accessory protein [Rhodoferax sp.]|jgi:iron-sulfur cluster assembly protein
MTITLTEAAAKQINAQLAKHGSGVGLRVGVKPVGCSGLTYTYDIADALQAGDQVFENFGAKLFVNAKALSSLDGSNLDYVTEGMKRAFQFDNPNVSSTCGCGESFNLKKV